MNINTFVAFAALALAACGGGGSADPTPVAPAPIRVFIFAGQSNMLGADAIIDPSGTKELIAAGLQTDADRSSLFTLGGAESYAWGDIRGHDGPSLSRPDIGGVRFKVHGPEVGFSRALGGNIAIVKYADNYQALEAGRSAWVKPGTRWTAWQAFVDKQLAALGRPYVVVGFVWHQGIDDGILHRSQVDYQADLEQVTADLREKFGNKPFILARSIGADGQIMDPIRTGQVAVGTQAGNAWITVDDLGPYINGHHLSATAQITAGQRFAAAWSLLP